MIINSPHLCTKLEVWHPRYSDGKVLLNKRKVDFGTAKIIIEFTKAKSLQGQRFAIYRKQAQRYPVTTNGKAAMYKIPMDSLENWDKASEVFEIINEIGW